MSKRPLAALCALLAFMAVLVAVPLAASEMAEAHTKTKQQCAFDPFAGNQCWTVNVPHSHGAGGGGRRPPTTTTTAPPPPTCPAGFTGTPPWCTRPTATTTAPPPTTTTTTAPPRPPRCATGHHRHGNTCHSHSFTPPCGTGTWAPHVGHTTQQRPACPPPPECADGYSGTPPNCVKDKPKTTTPPPDCAPVTRGRGVRHQRKHALGTGSAATTSACHPVNDSHCSTGEHEHAHGSQQCHTLGQKTDNSDGDHKGWTDHCPAGEHSHEHTGDCHLEKQQGWRFPEACRGPDADVRYHNHGQGLACHPVGADLCPVGQHEHKPGIYYRVRGCHDEDTQHGSGQLLRSEGYVYDAVGKIVCYGAAGLGAAAAGKLILKGASWIEQFVAGSPVGIGIDIGCEKLFDGLKEAEKNKREQEKKDHDDDSDDGDGTGDGSGEDADPEPEADPKPTAAEIKQNDDELNEAARRYRDEEITLAEYQAAFRRWMRWRCEEMGQTKWCNR